MKRRAFSILAALSLLLAVATVGVWTVSQWRGYAVYYQPGATASGALQGCDLQVAHGAVSVRWWDGARSFGPEWTLESFNSSMLRGEHWTLNLWFDYWRRSSVRLKIPLWFFTLLFLIPPLIWFRRHRHQWPKQATEDDEHFDRWRLVLAPSLLLGLGAASMTFVIICVASLFVLVCVAISDGRSYVLEWIVFYVLGWIADTRRFSVALWIILLGVGWRKGRKRAIALEQQYRLLAGCCMKCGYDLRGHALGQHCPECGTVVPARVKKIA